MKPSNEKSIKILLDLKPAFDGYAGIPQETRLLFSRLKMIAGYDVQGLIQHGGRKLQPAIMPGRSSSLTHQKRINRLSRMVVSLHETPIDNLFETAIRKAASYFALSLLRLRTLCKIQLTAGIFEPGNFEDFIWRTFFSKTLKPEDKHLVLSSNYRVISPSRKQLHKVGLGGLRLSESSRYVTIDTKDYDIFIAQTPFPGRVSAGTTMVVRYHDAVPIFMPHTVNDKALHQATHFYALQDNVKAGAYFSCVSEATRQDLLKIFPEVEQRSIVIHNIVSDEYFEENSPPDLVTRIVRNRLAQVDEFDTDISELTPEKADRKVINLYQPAMRRSRRSNRAPMNKGTELFSYLLMVSTIEPRKNHLLLLGAWERLKYSTMPDLKLVIVGGVGWDQDKVLNAFRPWAEQGELFYLQNVPSSELRALYAHAAVTVCPSLAEGFDYSGVEAMKCGGIVAASDIPVHREIYGNAAEYFSPYSEENAAAVLSHMLCDKQAELRKLLRLEGLTVSKQYTAENILPQWENFIEKIS